MRSIRLLLFITLPSLFCVSTAQAHNVHFFKNSIFEDLSSADIESLKTFLNQSLDKIEDQKISKWSSEKSETRGRFKVQFTYKSNENTCRRVLFRLEKSDKKEPYHFEVCKIDKKWKIKETAARNFRNSDWTMQEKVFNEAIRSDLKGTPFSWKNPNTGNGGSIIVLNSNAIDGLTCREIAVSIFSRLGQHSSGTYTFCKLEGDHWERRIEAFDL